MGRRPKSDLSPKLADLLKVIGRNIREIRQSQGLTQTDLAQRSKVSLTTLNEMETQAQRDVRLSTLVALAEVLSLPVAGLLMATDVRLESRDHARLLKASEDIQRIMRKIARED
jgi:transcriptional regulator with XRE-family HTH domain